MPPSLESGHIHVHAACVPPPHHSPSRLPARTSLPPASNALLSTRQRALAFNQPLSFDTSSVTTMTNMFSVRSPRALGPQALSWAFPLHASCVPPPHPRPSRLPAHTSPSPHRMCPLPSTRQQASAFNQPLSFDTSSVTIMSAMFYVRSAHAPKP